MDPLPMLRMLAAMSSKDDFPTDDESLLRLYRFAELTTRQKDILSAIYDLTRGNADNAIVQPWVKKWMTLLDDQEETCAICDLHMMILKWFSGEGYIQISDRNNFLHTHLSVLNNIFAKAKETLEDERPSYTERYELHHHYEDALTLLSADDTLSHHLHDLQYNAPDIYDHIVEYKDDLCEDFPDWAWEDMV